MDTGAALGVTGPPDPEKCNDYIAAVAELRRALMDLGLAALRLYPM